ncbi:MAG TPA: hypothetical protein VKD45_07695 [Hyphomicrobiaceae bacterium]|nr:hypothetical protein [Hyphomicrobiaceae bacterium]
MLGRFLERIEVLRRRRWCVLGLGLSRRRLIFLRLLLRLDGLGCRPLRRRREAAGADRGVVGRHRAAALKVGGIDQLDGDPLRAGIRFP